MQRAQHALKLLGIYIVRVSNQQDKNYLEHYSYIVLGCCVLTATSQSNGLVPMGGSTTSSLILPPQKTLQLHSGRLRAIVDPRSIGITQRILYVLSLYYPEYKNMTVCPDLIQPRSGFIPSQSPNKKNNRTS